MAYWERIQTKSQKKGHTHIEDNIIMLSYCTDNMIGVFINIIEKNIILYSFISFILYQYS